MTDLIVIGAGQAGVIPALRGADLAARIALEARAEFGGTAATNGPEPSTETKHNYEQTK